MTKSNIFKKIAAGIISLSMIIGAVPVMAEQSVDQDTTGAGLLQPYEIELLTKLGIVDEAKLKLASEELSRGVFAEMLAGLMGIGEVESAIEELYNLGIVSGYGGGSLKESQIITTYEAIKMVIGALGYATLSEQNGGFPLGYVKTAYDIKLIDGAISDENMTYEQGMKLVLDAGNATTATLKNESILGGMEFGGETMFYRYFDIIKLEGLLTANGQTSLDGPVCVDGEVIIAGNTALVSDTNAVDYIGYYVDAYAYDGKLDDELISIMPSTKYNKEINVLAGTYVNATSYGTEQAFTFEYEDENGKVARADVEDYVVIYNGERYGSFVRAMLNDSLADVTLIDNDRDNKYEIIKLNQYETYIVQSVNPEKFEIYAKYDKSLTLDPEEQAVSIFKASGKPGEFKDIASGTALSVLRSEDGDVVKAYILGESVSGLIEGMSNSNNHDVLTIDGKNYVVTYEYNRNLHEDKINPLMGSSIKAYLDLKGDIVEIELTSGVWLYGYIMKISYSVDEEKCTTLSIFSQSNKRLDLELGDKVVVDGVSRRIEDLGNPGIELVNFANPTAPRAIRQLVRYRETGGKLTHLDTWTTYNPALEDENALGATKDSDLVAANGVAISAVYCSGPKFFIPGSSTSTLEDGDILVGADNSSICFTVPSDEQYANDKSFYAAGGMNFGDGSAYSFGTQIDAYNINEAKMAKVFIRNITDTKNPDSAGAPLLLKNVSVVVNKNGEAAYEVEAINLNTGAEYKKVASAENTISTEGYRPANFFATKQFGDVFYTRDGNFGSEGSVLISAMSRVDLGLGYGCVRPGATAYTKMRVYSAGSSRNTYLAQYNEYVGKIGWANNTHMRLESDEINPGTGEREVYSFALSGAKVYLVDLAEETFETIDATRVASYTRDKIENEDYIVHLFQKGGAISCMLIYTNLSARD